MDDITLNLIALAVFMILGGGIFFLVRRKQAENEQKLIQMAIERGWTYESIREPLAWGLRLKSSRWTLEAISRSSGNEAAPGSSNVAMSTTWQADSPDSTALIGTRPPGNTGGLGAVFAAQVLQLALGTNATGLIEIQVGSETFRKKYMLWAQNSAEAEKLLTPDVEAALLAWKGRPILIKRTPTGLQIEISGQRLQKVDEIIAIIHLGEALLSA